MHLKRWVLQGGGSAIVPPRADGASEDAAMKEFPSSVSAFFTPAPGLYQPWPFTMFPGCFSVMRVPPAFLLPPITAPSEKNLLLPWPLQSPLQEKTAAFASSFSFLLSQLYIILPPPLQQSCSDSSTYLLCVWTHKNCKTKHP